MCSTCTVRQRRIERERDYISLISPFLRHMTADPCAGGGTRGRRQTLVSIVCSNCLRSPAQKKESAFRRRPVGERRPSCCSGPYFSFPAAMLGRYCAKKYTEKDTFKVFLRADERYRSVARNECCIQNWVGCGRYKQGNNTQSKV